MLLSFSGDFGYFHDFLEIKRVYKFDSFFWLLLTKNGIFFFFLGSLLIW